jgi:PhnB protein
MKVTTHLNFGGDCAQAFRFYERHLPGQVTTLMTAADLPPEVPRPGHAPDFVIHAVLRVAGVEVIGNDVPPERFKPIRSSYLYLSAGSMEEAERLWTVLAEGGEVTMPLAETFFATRFGQLRDRFGVLWTILHQRPA